MVYKNTINDVHMADFVIWYAR